MRSGGFFGLYVVLITSDLFCLKVDLTVEKPAEVKVYGLGEGQKEPFGGSMRNLDLREET